MKPSKEQLEWARRRMYTLFLMDAIKKKQCRCKLCRYLKKIVAWVEG